MHPNPKRQSPEELPPLALGWVFARAARSHPLIRILSRCNCLRRTYEVMKGLLIRGEDAQKKKKKKEKKAA